MILVSTVPYMFEGLNVAELGVAAFPFHICTWTLVNELTALIERRFITMNRRLRWCCFMAVTGLGLKPFVRALLVERCWLWKAA